MLKLYIRILILGLSGWGTTAWAQVHEFTLDNGLKVLVKEDHRAPVVVAQIWYKVGSHYEHMGITGVSHVLEHMMFKGTRDNGPGEFSRIIAEHGGRENAFTSRDYTAYFQQLEKSRLPVSFDLEADRMVNLTLPEEEFKKEVQVVIEERRTRTEDNPRSLTYEQLNATAFTSNPYHNPIIGWKNDLDNLRVEDLRDWYQRWYVPNNATLVVVGDVHAAKVHELAQTYYGKVAASEKIPAIKPRLEPRQRGTRRVEVQAPAKLPYLIMGYKVPVLKTAKEEWEVYALDMLSGVLSGSQSARFARSLVREKQIAADASAGYNMYSAQPDLFLFDGTPARGHSVAELEKAFHEQIEQLKNELVSQDELERIKAQVVAAKIYERDSLFYQAMQMGILETNGLGWQRMDEYADKLQAVTPEQIQKVAKKYFVPTQLTVAELKPLPVDTDAPATAPVTKH